MTSFLVFRTLKNVYVKILLSAICNYEAVLFLNQILSRNESNGMVINNKKNGNILWVILTIIFSVAGYAQNLEGNIVDDEGNPLEHAYIYNTRTSNHAHSTVYGTFVLENNRIGDSISIGLLGYYKKHIILNNKHVQNPIDVILKSKTILLEELVITEQINALNSLSKVDLELNPVNSSQEILRKVPGIIIGQHAGGGKAEQIFLRGFDIDHGTDITLSVDGMPVNMVSHAHGQGYADMHFIIPETIDNVVHEQRLE